MSDPKTPNPNYSPTKQHLLDLLALGDEELNTKAKEIMELLEDKADLLEQADELWDKHQYPDKHMRYIKSSNFDECNERYGVSGYAQAALSFLEHSMNQSNLIQASLDDIKDYCNMSRSSARNAVKDLIDNGLIATHTPQYSKQPPIFMVNPKVATAGKPKGETFYNAFEVLVYKNLGIPEHEIDEYKKKCDTNKVPHDEVMKNPLIRFEMNGAIKAKLASTTTFSRDGKPVVFNKIHLTAPDGPASFKPKRQKKESAPSDSTDSQ